MEIEKRRWENICIAETGYVVRMILSGVHAMQIHIMSYHILSFSKLKKKKKGKERIIWLGQPDEIEVLKLMSGIFILLKSFFYLLLCDWQKNFTNPLQNFRNKNLKKLKKQTNKQTSMPTSNFDLYFPFPQLWNYSKCIPFINFVTENKQGKLLKTQGVTPPLPTFFFFLYFACFV